MVDVTDAVADVVSDDSTCGAERSMYSRDGLFAMVESEWPELAGAELRYLDHTWRLTGAVDVVQNGELLAVDATRVDGVRHEGATLFFSLDGGPASLNPGNLGGHFDRLERDSDEQHILVRKRNETYRYTLKRLEYD